VNGIFEVKFRIRFTGGATSAAAIYSVSPEAIDFEVLSGQTSVYEYWKVLV
jgi:hypothetical protein